MRNPGKLAETYRVAFARLVREYNACKDPAWQRLEIPPTIDSEVRTLVRDMADILCYTDAEMRELGITWYD